MAWIKLYNKTGDEKAVRTQEALEKNFGGALPQVFQAMGRSGNFLNAVSQMAAAAGDRDCGQRGQWLRILCERTHQERQDDWCHRRRNLRCH